MPKHQTNHALYPRLVPGMLESFRLAVIVPDTQNYKSLAQHIKTTGLKTESRYNENHPRQEHAPQNIDLETIEKDGTHYIMADPQALSALWKQASSFPPIHLSSSLTGQATQTTLPLETIGSAYNSFKNPQHHQREFLKHLLNTAKQPQTTAQPSSHP